MAGEAKSLQYKVIWIRSLINAKFRCFMRTYLVGEIHFQIADPAFDGRMKDIESVFIEKLAEFVPLLLAPDNVVVKRIGGNEVRCKEIINFFKAYIDVFTGDEMPEPKSMLQATSEANNLASLSEAKDTYIAMMESVCGGDKPYINERVLDIEHCKMRDQGWLGFNYLNKVENPHNGPSALLVLKSNWILF